MKIEFAIKEMSEYDKETNKVTLIDINETKITVVTSYEEYLKMKKEFDNHKYLIFGFEITGE